LNSTDSKPPLTQRRIFRTWWPLAASWILLAVETPAIAAVIARLDQPEINLAAWGGVVFPIALIIEAPIMMLLAASTALSKDHDAYRRLGRFMMWTGGGLTILHILLAFTPLYDVLVSQIIHAPAEIVEPARLGLRLITPWTWSIAYRRFQQGVLIRFGYSEAVGIGTLVRLSADALVLTAGLISREMPGIAVASLTASAGVLSEAIYAGLRVRPVLRDVMRAPERGDEPLELRALLEFYVPLAMTSLMILLMQPIGSAAMSRMPDALASLAVWPVISGLVFLLRAPGVSYNEVVVALLDEPQATRAFQRYTLILIGIMSAMILIVASTPLARVWFERFAALTPHLANLGRQAVWFALPMPALNVLQSWYQGVLLNARKTRGITESVGVSIVTSMIILVIGIRWNQMPGLNITWLALSGGALTQVLWLWWRSFPSRNWLATNAE
jgi:hypothetical protein